MKKFILGAITALGLFASTSANATFPTCPFTDCSIVTTTNSSPTGALQFWSYDAATGNFINAGYLENNGTNPQWHFPIGDTYFGSDSMSTLMDSKASAASVATLSSTVAGLGTPFSGAYTDLTGKPSLFSGVYSDLTGKPTLFDGAYASLTGKPTIPTATSQLTNDSDFLTSAPVASVAGKTGTVTLVKGDVGLGNVDNTSDASKPVSTATATALSGKAVTSHTHAESDVTNLVTDLAGKASTSTVIGTGATLGTAATNASTSQVTNYNTLSGLLGISAGLNDANTAQNDLAAKYNDLASKYNTLLAMLKARNVPSN